MKTKRFPLRDLLTVTTGRLLTKPTEDGNGIENLYEIFDWMTSDILFTHQLPCAAEECKPWLLRWFPELSQAMGEDLDSAMAAPGVSRREGLEQWLLSLQDAGLKAEYDVPQIPADDHERKDAFDELIQMRGTDEGIEIIEIP